MMPSIDLISDFRLWIVRTTL